MPDTRELTRMLKDFQEFIPAIVGVIVAITSAIGLLVPSLEGSSSIGGDGSTQGGVAQPGITDTKYLTDHPNGVTSVALVSGAEVTVKGKDYGRSILSTGGPGVRSEKEYRVPSTSRTLNLKAAWVDTIPNSGGTGKVTVKRGGQLLGEITVAQGEIVEHNFDVRGGGRVEVALSAFDPSGVQKKVAPSGLAVLTPVLK